MKIYKFFLGALLFIFLFLMCKGLQAARRDGTVVEVLAKIEVLAEDDPDKAYELALEALSDAESSQDQVSIYSTFVLLGKIERTRSHFSEAYSFFRKALEMQETNVLERGILFYEIGYTDKVMGNYGRAIKNLYKAQELLASLNAPYQLGQVYNQLGSTYRNVEEWDIADNYFQKSLDQFEVIKDSLEIAKVLFNQANQAYLENDLTTAEKNLRQVIPIFAQRSMNRRLTKCYNLLGAIFYDQDEYDLAEINLKKSLQIGLEEKQVVAVFDAYFNLSLLEYSQDSLDNALSLANEAAMVIDDEDGFYHKKYLLNEQFRDIYEELGQIEYAFFHAKILLELKDSIYNKESIDAQAKYATFYQLKEMESSENRRKLQTQKMAGLLIITIMVLFMLLGSLVYRQKQKIKDQKEYLALIRKSHELEMFREGQKTERSRLAMLLHDGLGSRLAASKWLLEYLNETYSNNGQLAESLGEILVILEDCYRMVREALVDLRKRNLEFVSYLERFVKFIDGTSRVEVSFASNVVSSEIKSDIGEHFELIGSELITNAWKAKAQRIDVQINQFDSSLLLFVEDNGPGFDVEKIRRGNGLNNIEQRVHEMNGSLIIDSKPGHGTTISIEVPL